MTNRHTFSGLIAPLLALTVLVGGLVFAGSVNSARATAGAEFNQHPDDFPVLEVSNYTDNPGCNTCWSSSISNVQDGDVISFVFYVHNTGDASAMNTHLKLIMDESGNGIVANGRVIADNASPVFGTARVNMASNVDDFSLTFVGSEFYRDSTVDPNNPDALPGGQSGRVVAEAGPGVNIGHVPADPDGTFDHDAQFVVRYRVEADEIVDDDASLRVVPSSDTIDVNDTAQYRAFYDPTGGSTNDEFEVTGSASWTTSNSSVASSLGSGRYRGNREGTITVRATYQGESDDATLHVEDDGDRDCDDDDAELRIAPSSDTIDVGDTADYRAFYDEDGPDCDDFRERDVTNSASWSSSNSSVASSRGQGEFRGNREGSITVRASYRGESDNANLRVRDNDDDDDDRDRCDDEDETLVIIPASGTTNVGGTFPFRALYDPDGPGCSDSGDRDVTSSAAWSSENTGVASSLGSGQFRGNAQGTAGIRASFSGVTARASLAVVGAGVVLPPPVITLPPTVIGGGTTVVSGGGGAVAGVATQGVACVIVTPSIDVTELRPGVEFVYTTFYRNDCNFVLDDAILRIYLPNEVDFLASSNPYFIREGQKFSYPLGPLDPGEQGSVAIRGYVRKDAHLGDTLLFTSMIEFMDFRNRMQNTTSYLSAVLGQNINKPLTASISDTLGDFIRQPIAWLLLLIIIIALIVWGILSRRGSVVSERSTTTTVTDRHDDPLRGLRNA